MLKILWLAPALLMTLIVIHRSAPAEARSVSTTEVAGQVIVRVHNRDDLAAVAADFGLDPSPIERFRSSNIYRMRIADGATPGDRSQALVADLRVAYAEPNSLVVAPEARSISPWSVGGNAGGAANQWAAGALHLPAAHAITRGGGVTVAVVDTGIDRAHPAFAGRLVPGYDFVDNDADPSEVGGPLANPGFGHGTHVAGLVAMVAPDARIMPIRALDPNGVGSAWTLANALAFAADPDGDPATNDGVEVVNLSLSYASRSLLIREVIGAVTCGQPHAVPDHLACFRADGGGAVVVAAAGNSGSGRPEFPAGDRDEGTISVGALSEDGTVAPFSNFGSPVDLAAPGARIIGPVPGGIYGTWSGTSMATALVAGEAALVRAHRVDLSAAAAATHVVESAPAMPAAISRRADAAASLQ